MIRRSKPLARSTKPIPRKRAKPRRGPMRDPDYLQFLREEGKCVAETAGCALRMLADFGKGRCDPAHGPANGYGSKGPDDEALSLCRPHHDEQTRLGCERFAQKYGFNWQKEAAALYALYQIWKEGQCPSG